MLTKVVHRLPDNAPAHLSQVAVEKTSQCDYEILQHPPYFHHFVKINFFLFPEMKKLLRGGRFHKKKTQFKKWNSGF